MVVRAEPVEGVVSGSRARHTPQPPPSRCFAARATAGPEGDLAPRPRSGRAPRGEDGSF